jgi:hypothetical protein
MLVLMDSLFPGLGNQYAAIGAWDTQLTDQPVSASRPSNLQEPADHDADAGAHGIFDHRAGGVLDPSFVRTLPSTAKTFATAISKTVKEARSTHRAKSSDGEPLAAQAKGAGA